MKTAFDISSATAFLTRGRPLAILDADEVLLRFVDGFDRYLRQRGLYLDLISYRLHGNVKRQDDNTTLLDVEVTALLDDFRAGCDALEAVTGASDVLAQLTKRLDLVVVSNISAEQAVLRARNFLTLGFSLPLIANSGPKGPTIKALMARAGRPCFFLDDIPQNLASAAKEAPDVLRIHLVGDDRLKPLLPAAPDAHLRAEDWDHAYRFIDAHLSAAGY